MSTKAKRVSVAAYLTQQINICGKSQLEIAEEVGYTKPNMITMIKQGKTKLPINKIPAFAKALGVDPVHLLRITMSEYMPETWDVMESLLGEAIITEGEKKVLEIVRARGEGLDVAPEGAAEVLEFEQIVDKWLDRSERFADAARRRVEQENRHMNQGNPVLQSVESTS